jgi:hypothetical protein
MSEPNTGALYKRVLECPDKTLNLIGESSAPYVGEASVLCSVR